MADRANEPWTLAKVPEEPDTFLIGDDGLFWARIVGSPGRPAEPRARLLWAARDLLNACRELLGYVEAEYGYDSYPDEELDPKASGHEGVVARARLAIAKATTTPAAAPGRDDDRG